MTDYPSDLAGVETQIARHAPFLEEAGKTFVSKLEQEAGRTFTPTEWGQMYQGPASQNILGQQGLQQAATQAGLGALTFGGPGGTVSDVGQGTGLAGYQPYLDASTAAANAISNVGIAGQGAGAADIAAARGFTGPQAYQQFMSPYQQQVIDASRASFENQRAQQRASIADAASQYGAFGGGRQGVQEGVYDAQTTLGMTGLEADLRAQGYQQAQQLAQQAYGNQLGLAGQMQNQVGQNIAALQQSIIEQDMAMGREQAFEEQQRLGYFGQQYAPMVGGFGSQSTYTTNVQPPPSPLQTMIGVGGIAGGLMGGLGSILHGGG